jgi:hypothetical protein
MVFLPTCDTRKDRTMSNVMYSQKTIYFQAEITPRAEGGFWARFEDHEGVSREVFDDLGEAERRLKYLVATSDRRLFSDLEERDHHSGHSHRTRVEV